MPSRRLNPILTLATACSLLITSAVPASVLAACCCEAPSASPASCCAPVGETEACACCLPVAAEPDCCAHRQTPAQAEDQPQASERGDCSCEDCERIGPAEPAPAIPPRGDSSDAAEQFSLASPALDLPVAQVSDEIVREDFLLPLPQRPVRERFCVWVI